MTAPARVVDDDPARHRVRAVPLGRRQPAHQRRARPGLADAGVQGVRRRRWRVGMSRASRRRRQRHGRGPAVRGARRPRVRRPRHRPRRRAGPAVQPDPALRRARGHPPARRARPCATAAWYADTASTLRLGTRVARGRPRRGARSMLVDGDAARLRPAGAGHRLDPDAAADPRPGAEDGSLHPKVHAFRSLADCLRLLDARCPAARTRRRRRRRPARPPGRPGAGRARRRHRGRRGRRAPAARASSTPAAERCSRRDLRRLGTEVYTGARAVRLTDEGLRLDNGYTLRHRPGRAHRRRPARRPRWPAGPGCSVRRGVVVDGTSRSVTDERIHAIGDCAEHARTHHRLRAPGLGAGRGAGRRTSPAATRRYDGSRSVARLRATGLDVAVLGDPEHDRRRGRRGDQPGRRARYRKLVVRGGVIEAAALVGDLSRVGPDHPALRPAYRPRPARAGRAADGRAAARRRLRRCCPTTPRSAPARASAPGRIRACADLDEAREHDPGDHRLRRLHRRGPRAARLAVPSV